MTTLSDLPIDLYLFNPVKRGLGPIRNVKAQMGATWRRSIRSAGGFWLGTADYAGTPDDWKDLFLYGLACEVQETIAGGITWQGFIAEMDLTLSGVTYVRRWLDIANAVQVIYTKLGDNLFTNGSVESAAWTDTFNNPDPSSGRSTTWKADGAYSMYIDVASAFHNAGFYIQPLASPISIVAGQAYDVQVVCQINSLTPSATGMWTLAIQKHGAGVDGSGHPASLIASGGINVTGQQVIRASIPSTNTYAGQVDVCVYCKDAYGTGYFDAATFRISPVQARTNWYSDAQSQSEYGTCQLALLQSSMSDDTANSHAQTALNEQRWPRTIPPSTFGPVGTTPDGLKLTVAGYAWMMRNKYVPSSITGLTENASLHVSNIVADCEFVTAGAIAANTFQYQVDNRAPLREWATVEAIIQAGDLGGNCWTGGVYANRVFNYQPANTVPDYRFRGGALLNLAGGVVEPWLVQPALIYMDDMPAGPASLTPNQADDPHVIFVEEVEYDAAAWLAGNTGLNLTLIAGSDQAA